MPTHPDDLEAVRQIASTLEPFPEADRERIIRWAREKLGMASHDRVTPASQQTTMAATASSSTAPDIKAFVQSKNPKNDLQLAATVAYYYRFIAPEAERKETISAEDVLEACRKADRKRPASAPQTLVNAFGAGLFDRAGKGAYRLNSVGENLVAMVLPGEPGSAPAASKVTRKAKGKQGKKAARKPSATTP